LWSAARDQSPVDVFQAGDGVTSFRCAGFTLRNFLRDLSKQSAKLPLSAVLQFPSCNKTRHCVFSSLFKRPRLSGPFLGSRLHIIIGRKGPDGGSCRMKRRRKCLRFQNGLTRQSMEMDIEKCWEGRCGNQQGDNGVTATCASPENRRNPRHFMNN
jgi:hypothetical protein